MTRAEKTSLPVYPIWCSWWNSERYKPGEAVTLLRGDSLIENDEPVHTCDGDIEKWVVSTDGRWISIVEDALTDLPGVPIWNWWTFRFLVALIIWVLL